MAEVLYAMAPGGLRLPVIDITNPAFVVDISEAAADALAAAALAEEEARGPLQRLLFRLVWRQLARRSRLVAALRAAGGGYLGGLDTYVMKLGPANLVPPYDGEIDRRILQSPAVTSMRMRLAGTATLLAGTLASELRGNARPLVILEIAGGPSADALNALILLARDGLLAGRSTLVTIYDVDDDGPAFAAAMLSALQQGPLADCRIEIEHVRGNWRDTEAIGRLVAAFPADAVVAATSEGGLFEYGTDSDSAGVLGVLRPRVGIVTGSVTRAGRLDSLLRRNSRAATLPRSRDAFAALVAPAGYAIAATMPAPLSLQVLLRPAG
jgi:hypothetical protein